MSKEEKTTEIPTKTCSKCEREWPEISEQCVFLDMYGECYSCAINEVVAERDRRMKEADYMIENCPQCTGIPGAREKCTTCFGRGWRKQEGAGVIQLVT